MNVIDIILLVILVIAFVYGCVKGLIKSVGAVVGAIVGFVAAKGLSAAVQPWLSGLMPAAEEGTLRVVAFIVVFLLAWLLCSLAFHLIEKLFNAMMLGWVNRLLGGVLSLLLTVAVASLLLNVYDYLDPKHQLMGDDNVKASELYEPIRKSLPSVFPSLDMETWRKPSLKMPELPDFRKAIPDTGNKGSQKTEV